MVISNPRTPLPRCQGLTLDRAKVSLRNMFAEGQAYVALSRVRGMDGLEILGATKGCVKVRGPRGAAVPAGTGCGVCRHGNPFDRDHGHDSKCQHDS